MSNQPISSRNLALELVRVTETAAIAASRWIGMGEKNLADKAAVDAMRRMISSVSMDGLVVIGEGEKDEAPMLFNGEQVGDGTGPACDVAVDPIDGTTLTAKGMNNAISVIAVSERGSMFDPSAVFYMEKLVAGPESADVVDITAPAKVNLKAVAKAKHMSVSELTVVVLDRPRHDELVRDIREAGARIKFITDGDVRRCLSNIENLIDIQAKDIMTSHPITVKAESSLGEALSLMEDRENKIGVLPVVDTNDQCIGVIRLHDIAGRIR